MPIVASLERAPKPQLPPQIPKEATANINAKTAILQKETLANFDPERFRNRDTSVDVILYAPGSPTKPEDWIRYDRFLNKRYISRFDIPSEVTGLKTGKLVVTVKTIFPQFVKGEANKSRAVFLIAWHAPRIMSADNEKYVPKDRSTGEPLMDLKDSMYPADEFEAHFEPFAD